MKNKGRETITISLSLSAKIVMIACLMGIFILVIPSFLLTIWRDPTLKQIIKIIIGILVIIPGILAIVRNLFYNVTVTKTGIEASHIFGIKHKYFLWDEIIEVRRSRFRLPYQERYIISKKRGKIMLTKGLENYEKLIQIIEERAPNLRKCEY